MHTKRVSSAVGIYLLTIAILAVLGPSTALADEAAVKKCIAELGSADAMTRMMAAKALGQMGAEAQVAIPALRAVADSDPDEDVRMIAANAIRKIEAAAPPPVEPPKPVVPPALPEPPVEEVSAEDIEIVSLRSIFCQGYKDVTGQIKTPSCRFFMLLLKNNGAVPVRPSLLTVTLEEDGDVTGSEAVEGPEAVLPPGRSAYCCFELPLKKATIRCAVEVKAVTPVTLGADALEKQERNSRLLEQMQVMKVRSITKFGVQVGEKFSIHNPDARSVANVRIAILGFDAAGKLTNVLFYHLEEVPSGFSKYENNPTNAENPRTGEFVFDGVADAKRDVFPESFKGLVVGVGVPKHED